jgi:hypothetical protein
MAQTPRRRQIFLQSNRRGTDLPLKQLLAAREKRSSNAPTKWRLTVLATPKVSINDLF